MLFCVWALIDFTIRWIFLTFMELAVSLQVYQSYYVMASAFLSLNLLLEGLFCDLGFRLRLKYITGYIIKCHLIEIILKIIAIVLILMGTSLKEISILCVILIFSIKFLVTILVFCLGYCIKNF
jgi:hypothetical protein